MVAAMVAKLIESAAAIMTEPPERVDFLHTVLAQCGMPHRNPGDAVRVWDRQQGAVALRIEAGAALHPVTRRFVELGLPYGEKPRLVMIHLSSEAVRTGSPVVEVEDSLTAFVRSLGLPTDGRTIRTLKDQLGRLAVATIRLAAVEDRRTVQINTPIVDAFDLWAPDDARQRVLWPSTVRLSPGYFASLQRHAVPLDHRAVGALAASSLALDIYAWLAQRLHRVPPGRGYLVPWPALKEQFGPGYQRVRAFRGVFLPTLRRVLAVYPAARLEVMERGLVLRQSPPPVPRKSWPALGKP
jgi:hypothetical protein